MSNSRRERRMAIQSKGIGGGSFEKVFDYPESVQKLKLEVMKPVVFDIIPTIIDEHHPNYNIIKSDAEKYGDRCDDWCVPYALHKSLQGVSQHVCRNWGKIGDRKCPTCDLRGEAVSSGADPKSDAVRQYNASQRVALCVCPVGGEQDGEMVLLDGAKSWVYDKIKEAADRENVFLLDTSIDGMSIKATPQAFSYTDNKTHEKVTIPGELYIEFVPRTFGYENSDLEEALPICDYLNFKSYEEIYTMVHGLTSMPESEEDEEIIENKPSARAGRASTQDVEATPAQTIREPNTNSRRGRGASSDTAEATSEAPTTTRGRRGRTAPVTNTDATEDEIVF